MLIVALDTRCRSHFFGVGDALQLRMQTLGISFPYELMVALPWVLDLLALVGLVGRSHAPKAVGVAFSPGRRTHRAKVRRMALR